MKPSERIKAIMKTDHLAPNEDYVLTVFEQSLLDYLDEEADKA